MQRAHAPLLVALLVVAALAPAAPAAGVLVQPLAGEAPAWWPGAGGLTALDAGLPVTGSVADALREAGFDGTPRPGAMLVAPAWCTAGFLLHHAATGRVALTTAGHCTTAVGDPVSLLVAVDGADGRVVLDAVEVGVTTARWDAGVGSDLSLVVLHPASATRADAGMLRVDGPCGAASSARTDDPLVHVGHGVGAGTAGTPRVGVGEDGDAASIRFKGFATPGDSGGPVRLSGPPADTEPPLAGDARAVGLVTHVVGYHVDGVVVPTGVVKGTSIARVLELAGSGWELVDSPRC